MDKWTNAAKEVYNETREALQLVFDALNQGQQKKILKNESVAELFKHYGVDTGGAV